MASLLTTSVFRMEAERGKHRVKIVNHSLISDFPSGKSFQCGTFTIGEYQWAILYYPNGLTEYYSRKSWKNHISFYVRLLSETIRDLDIHMCVSLLDQSGITSHHQESMFYTIVKKEDECGFSHFMRTSNLPDIVEDDSFTVECTLQVFKSSIEEDKGNNSISVPPSNMHEHLFHLLQSGKGADISFKVKGETFSAHRSILAARSSVLNAELYGSMRESKDKCIQIQDMEPQIFKVLLHFIYSDVLHLGDDHADQGVDEDSMIHHLIVAADRYDLDRLRLICEEKLAKKIGADNVVTTLALAAQHNCRQLKEMCLDYISSSKNLHSFTETDVFASFVVSCPSIYKELLEKVDSKRRT